MWQVHWKGDFSAVLTSFFSAGVYASVRRGAIIINLDEPSQPQERLSLEYEVETPEDILLHYQLAGPSVRMMAYGIDFLIRLGLTGLLGLSLIFLGIALPGVASGIFFIWLFLNGWGYYIISEGFFRGKSLGKHVFGLRVVHELGYPINMRMAVTRNLIRAVDSVPFYIPALISMFCSKQFQRLGDHASGTIVITERKVRLPREPIILEKIERLPSHEINLFVPDEQTLAVIADFLSRRVAVRYERGHEISYPLARELASNLKYSGDPELVKKFPMAFLARVYVTFLKTENQNQDQPESSESPSPREVVLAGEGEQ